jgi:hypothetical protein
LAKKRISVQAAKAKGRRLQQWVCERISLVTGFEWGASGKDCPIESRPMGQNGCDVRMESQVLELFPFSVECKYQEKWAIPAWIKQAKANMLPGTNWLLFVKKNNDKPIVVMDAQVFFDMMEQRAPVNFMRRTK